MSARLRIFLKAEEDRTLFEMRKASRVPQRVKDRAEALRINAQGWYVEKIANYFNWHPPGGLTRKLKPLERNDESLSSPKKMGRL
jgi:hypothetical protein